MKVRTQFRQIFLEMGMADVSFSCVKNARVVVIRFHKGDFFRVGMDHSVPCFEVESTLKSGDWDSICKYKYDWKIEEAQKNILRTHTTAVSARMLYRLAQQECFSFSPVFHTLSVSEMPCTRSLVHKHMLFIRENVMEGFLRTEAAHILSIVCLSVLQVACSGSCAVSVSVCLSQCCRLLTLVPVLSLSVCVSLCCILLTLVAVSAAGLKKWVEVGNSGVFRPEMLLPMGLPEGVSVIAWGLSLERPTMIKYGINNIRELVGHKVNLQMVYDSPVCRLDA
ncbi:SYFA ligase, partial [Polyodon spathula]|nr:SYFA ligase [Polyodon spathula]